MHLSEREREPYLQMCAYLQDGPCLPLKAKGMHACTKGDASLCTRVREFFYHICLTSSSVKDGRPLFGKQ